MSLRLLCVRHGEAENSRRGVVAGRKEYPLTERGREQAREVAGLLERLGEDPFCIYTSPLPRARKFAELLAEHLPGERDLFVEELLNEIDMGELAGADRERVLGGEGGRKLKNLLDFSEHGGEDYFDIRDRARRFFHKLIESHYDPEEQLFPTGPVVIVGHGGMLTQILSERSSYPRPRLTFFRLDNGELVGLSVERRYGRFIARIDYQIDPELAEQLGSGSG